MRRRGLWLLVLALMIPILAVSAQRFRGRRAPGSDPNPNVT